MLLPWSILNNIVWKISGVKTEGEVAKTVLNYRECGVSGGLSIKIDRKDDNDIDCIG